METCKKIVVVLVMLFLYNCNIDENKSCKVLYGKEFNTERIKQKIPIIPEDWITTRKGICEKDSLNFRYQNAGVQWHSINYLNSNDEYKKGKHIWKVVVFNSHSILEEQDRYFGIRKGNYFNSDLYEINGYEYLTITYSYKAKKENKYPWSVDAKVLNKKDFPTSLRKADSLLKSWGISRVNY